MRTTNNLTAITTDYNKAIKQAREYIMANCFWSRTTYYNRMKGNIDLTPEQNKIVAFAYKKFIAPVIELVQYAEN